MVKFKNLSDVGKIQSSRNSFIAGDSKPYSTLEDSLAVSYIAKRKLTYLALMLQLSGKHSPVYTYL